MAGRKGYSIVNLLISLVLTLGVNHQDLVVGENVAARVYANPEIKIHPIYVKKYKYHVVKKKKKINISQS